MCSDANWTTFRVVYYSKYSSRGIDGFVYCVKLCLHRTWTSFWNTSLCSVTKLKKMYIYIAHRLQHFICSLHILLILNIKFIHWAWISLLEILLILRTEKFGVISSTKKISETGTMCFSWIKFYLESSKVLPYWQDWMV